MWGYHGMNRFLKLFLLHLSKEVIKKQLPLKLAWGLTIHKSQGLTLERATINIGKQERQGMTFTAISQVKYLAGIRFQPPFSYD